MRAKFLILFLPVLLLSSCVNSQLATKEELNHEFVVEYPGLTKQVLFDRTLKWIANNFRSAKQVIEYQDKEAGSIVGNGITELKAEGALLGAEIEFTMNIDVRNGKVRYRFINLTTIIMNNRSPMPDTQAWHKPAQQKFERIIESIKTATLKNDDF